MDIPPDTLANTKQTATSMVAQSCKAGGFVVVNRNNKDSNMTHALSFFCERGRQHLKKSSSIINHPVNSTSTPPDCQPAALDSKPKATKTLKKFHTRPSNPSERCGFQFNVYFHKEHQGCFFPRFGGGCKLHSGHVH